MRNHTRRGDGRNPQTFTVPKRLRCVYSRVVRDDGLGFWLFFPTKEVVFALLSMPENFGDTMENTSSRVDRGAPDGSHGASCSRKCRSVFARLDDDSGLEDHADAELTFAALFRGQHEGAFGGNEGFDISQIDLPTPKRF